MDFYSRNYTGGAEIVPMLALAQNSMQAHQHVVDLPYRLSSWALGDADNIRMWFDADGSLVAWGALQTPFWTIDVVCPTDFEQQLHAEILAWADFRARVALQTTYGRPAWFVMVFPWQDQRIQDLEQAGFTCQADVGEDSWSQVLMRRWNEKPVHVYPIPAGYHLRCLAGKSDVEGYVALHQAVFESKNMTVDWRRRVLQQVGYRPELDVVIEATGGELAAFCIGWYDEKTCLGQIEPLGCGRNHRRLGLGRSALSEVLNRLYGMGAQQIYVETDNYRNAAFQLYQSYDFEVIQEVLVFRKEYGQ